MNKLDDKIIKEIAEELSMGLRAFIHKTNLRLLFVPKEDDLDYTGEDAWAEELKELAENPDDYYEIEGWISDDSYRRMRDFAEHLTDKKVQNKLLDALNKRKPFREFRAVLDNSGEFLDLWYDFKAKAEQEFVAKNLDSLFNPEEE